MSKKEAKNSPAHISKSAYAERMVTLQVELERMARWLEQTGQRLVVILEGRDTSGKGGTIAAIAERLNPRKCRVAALGTPSDREAAQWYFQRYVEYLPAAGEIVLFDRSWYNRAGVEAVMKFCTPAQTSAFLKQAPRFERMLVDDGILLFKYWLTVDQVEQEKRFADRLNDPLKRWKLSPIDLEARKHYDDYGRARDRMLEATHTRFAPWTLVDFNDQKRGRLALIRDLIDRLPKHDVLPNGALALPPLPAPPQHEHFSPGWKPI
jgi:polyphosphate kinase 2